MIQDWAMSSPKASFVATLYRRLGESMGFVEPVVQGSQGARGRSEEEVRDALLAVEEMGRFQRSLGRKGAKRNDVRRWINEGRAG